MTLSDVSKTAIVTLRSRAIESAKQDPLLSDPMAEVCLSRLRDAASADERTRLFDRKLPSLLTRHIALRARQYDAVIADFLRLHRSATVVNLGCGFDTRYWRIDHSKCTYVELDLPETVAMKRAALSDHIEYPMIARSVLDLSWLDEVPARTGVLFVAEGLLMYLPGPEVIALFEALSARFSRSGFVFEVVTEKYTHGIWKRIVAGKTKRQLGLESGASYSFGVRNARDIESFASGIRVEDEWSFVDDPDLRPRFYKYLGISRTQWTITASINAE